MDADQFLNFWAYYRGQPHQQTAVRQLFAQLPPQLRDDAAEWVRLYRTAPTPGPIPPLKVTYFAQNDNQSGTGYRECFSSSCAMLAAFHGRVAGDDAYNVIRGRYGDTTEAQAQLQTLRHLGLRAEFRTNGTREALLEELRGGRPVAVGWLHKGPANAPTGSGHWSVVIGADDRGVIMHDPNGEADLVHGGYLNRNGARRLYSWANWEPRWRVDGTGGWLVTAQP
jgi:hypothetical protein